MPDQDRSRIVGRMGSITKRPRKEGWYPVVVKSPARDRSRQMSWLPARMPILLGLYCQVLFAGVCFPLVMAAQAVGAPFQNLDFEMANVPYLPPGEYGNYVSIEDALPGWNAFLGGSPLTQILYNNWTFGGSAIWLWGPAFPGPRLEGNFDIFMIPGYNQLGVPPEIDDVSLIQVGLIPAGAQSILFRAVIGSEDYPLSDIFGLYLGGQNIPVILLETTADYLLLGGDVSGYEGTETELKLTAFWIDGTHDGLQLDAITFSTEPIPESSVVTLLGLGGLWFFRRLLLRKRT